MALQIVNLKRVFKMKNEETKKEVVLADPNPNMSPQEVVKFYSSEYPELTNAKIEGPNVVKDQATYTLSTKAGQLG